MPPRRYGDRPVSGCVTTSAPGATARAAVSAAALAAAPYLENNRHTRKPGRIGWPTAGGGEAGETAMPGRRPYPKPVTRPLAVYAFDPTVGRRLHNNMTVSVPYETLHPGPIGRKVAVIDYDASNKRYYQPVDLDDPHVLLGNGMAPSESDPRFHQQMVYAVVSSTIARFEFALGREVRWRPTAGTRTDTPFRSHLRVFPHAFQQANAFYDPQLRALLFGYFAASEAEAGDNLPGQTVFTCLSHDIVAHETAHAVVDSIRTHFSEATSVDTAAFHEGFADIVALFQHFSMADAVFDTINRTGGLIHRAVLDPRVRANGEPQITDELSEANPLVGLAKQFGEAMGTRKALREALGTRPDPGLMRTLTEPHSRGAILVAAVFEAYFQVYLERTRDLMRIGRGGDRSTDLHPDLAQRLTDTAVKTAGHFLNICIRALDYCPPVDIQLGEFLRAIITADSDLVPDDPFGYRAALINAFRRRGIVPAEVVSYSEGALRWYGPADLGKDLPPCRGLRFDMVHEIDAEARRQNAARQQRNAFFLNRFAKQHAADLGLDAALPIQPHSFHPIYRIAPNGRLVVEFVVEFLQRQDIPVDPGAPDGPSFQFRGGSTVIFDHHGYVKYVIQKYIGNEERRQAQRAFRNRLSEVSAFAIFHPDVPVKLDFAAIHRGN
jgi:hypothetical protein